MKHKFSSMGRVAIALVLALSLSLVMAVPAAATHDSTATVAFTDGQSTQQGEPSTLDVEVTNSAGSLGNIDEVVIDFSGTDFTVTGTGDPTDWSGTESPDNVITYTATNGGIAPGDSETFVPAVTNPSALGLATNPVVTTSDVGSKAVLVASEATGQIAYEAIAIGSAGNDFTVEYLDAESFSEMSATMVGNAISVELADDGTDPTSTATEVVAAIDTAATGEVDASTAAGTTIVPVMSATALSGGSGVQLDKPCPLTGALVITELLLTVDVTATPDTSASLAAYAIAFTTIEAIAVDETITITFPAEYDITGVLLVDVSVTGYIGTEVVTVVGQVVTITADGTNPIAAADEAVEVTIADNVKNPAVSGDYDIAVLTTAGDHGDGTVTIIPFSFEVVAGTANEVTAGAAFAVTVTAQNADSDTDTGYTGAHYIDFTSTATTPILIDFELITFNAGVGVSASYFVLPVAEAGKTITADATEPTITGISDAFDIDPATLVEFGIAGQGTKVAGIAQDAITVTAKDADGNTVADYTGTVTLTSTDGQAELPAAYTFTSGDAGEHVFSSGIILKTVGTDQTITVADAVAGVSTESSDITVTPAAADSIVVSASTGVIEADNSDSATITVTALDEFDNVDTNLSGDQSLTIASSLGAIAAANPSFTAGVAETTLDSDEIGTATIRVEHATYDDTTTTVKMLADIGITTITVTVDKSTILNNDVDVRTITATYTDGTATITAAVGADYAFTFSVDDPDTVLSTTDPVNPVAGVATVTLTTTATKDTVIAVTADGTGAADDSEDITATEGTFEITLSQGWNLISLPLIPDVAAIETVLVDLIDAGTVDWVDTFVYEGGLLVEKKWDLPAILQITEINDGQGYWVKMTAGGTLAIRGSELPAPPLTPPTYTVYEGWNLIGFKSLDAATNAEDYLGEAIAGISGDGGTLETMYAYDANAGIYTVIQWDTNLVPGAGYWLAVSAEGTIYP